MEQADQPYIHYHSSLPANTVSEMDSTRMMSMLQAMLRPNTHRTDNTTDKLPELQVTLESVRNGNTTYWVFTVYNSVMANPEFKNQEQDILNTIHRLYMRTFKGDYKIGKEQDVVFARVVYPLKSN